MRMVLGGIERIRKSWGYDYMWGCLNNKELLNFLNYEKKGF